MKVAQVLETPKHFVLVCDSDVARYGRNVVVGGVKARAIWPTGILDATTVGVLKGDLPGEDKASLIGKDIHIEP